MGLPPKVADRPRPSLAVREPDIYDPDDLELPPCPDETPKRFQLDAKLWEGQFRDGRLIDHRVTRYPTREHVRRSHRRLRETVLASTRLREWDVDWWSRGATESLPWLASGGSALTRAYVPLLPGPWSRQQYWSDYFATSAKSFESYHHDPLAHRGVELQTEFLLSRGVEARFEDEADQKKWDAFHRAVDLDRRLDDVVRDLAVFGETMIRWFPTRGPSQWTIRLLDPASVYEIVTDQEDWETVFFYHQQFQTRAELFAPPSGAGGAPTGPTPSGLTKYVVRQIPAEEIDHYRVNVTSGEVRGRPDLFPSLGYLKRLRDLMTARVVRADMLARMVFRLQADATPGEIVQLVARMFPQGRAPAPGSVVSMNKQVDLEPFEFKGSADSGAGVEAEVYSLIALIAVGMGVPMQYLFTPSRGGGARANALVATEPGAKHFEKRQGLLEKILHKMADRVVGEDSKREFIFPSIVTEERTQKLKDLAYAESSMWIAKETAATTAAKELGFTTYDFEDEQKKIADQFADLEEDEQGGGKIRRPLMAATDRQTPMLDPTKGHTAFEDLPPGLQLPEDGSMPGAANGAVANGNGGPPKPTTRSGFPADENPASTSGAANIRRDNKMQEGFITVTPDQLTELLREARAPRRRPDDPRFRETADRYAKGTAENVKQFVADVTSGLPLTTREEAARAALREAAEAQAAALEKVVDRLEAQARETQSGFQAAFREAVKELADRPVVVDIPESVVNPRDIHVSVDAPSRKMRLVKDEHGAVIGSEPDE